MANSISHTLPFPIYGAKYTIPLIFGKWDGETVVPDTRVSKDGGAFAACIEELTEISGLTDGGCGYITLTATEMTAKLVNVAFYYTNVGGIQPTFKEIIPRKLPVLASGTLNTGGSTSSILAASAAGYAGAVIFFNGGTGAGQAREIESVSGSTVNFSALETNTDATTTYQILQTDNMLSSGGTPPTAGEIADEVRVELATELGRIDVAVSTRLATVGYTAPLDAAGIRSAVGLSTNNLDTQLDNIPTNTEFNNRTLEAASYATAANQTSMISALTLILEDTNELQTDFTSGGVLETYLDEIHTAAITDIPALIAEVPTVTEFNARTLLAAEYATSAGVISANTIATAVWALAGAIAGKTPAEALRIIGALVAGTTDDAGTAQEKFRDFAGTLCVTVDVDTVGERSGVTYH